MGSLETRACFNILNLLSNNHLFTESSVLLGHEGSFLIGTGHERRLGNMKDSVTQISAGARVLLLWSVCLIRLPSLVPEERVDYQIGFESSMLVESAPTMTVVLAVLALASVLGLKALEERMGILADCGSCSLPAANAQAIIGAEMMDHSVQVDEFPTMSFDELHQLYGFAGLREVPESVAQDVFAASRTVANLLPAAARRSLTMSWMN